MNKKTGFMEIANRASLNTNTGSLDGLTNRISHHESSTNLNAHQISNIAGLENSLSGKAPTNHTHTIANVSGLQSALDGKQNIISGHSGTLTIVTSVDFVNQTFQTAQVNVSNGIITKIN